METISMSHDAHRPIILGIVGNSAAGKTTLATGIATILGSDRVAILNTDDYHRYDRGERRRRDMTALDPRASYVDILEQHLALLRDGEPVLKPVYDHAKGRPGIPEYLTPKPFLVVEGLLGFHTRALREAYDVKVFLEPDEDLRTRWRLTRDCTQRGYSAQEVYESMARRQNDSLAHIQPQRTFADIVVRFSPAQDSPAEDIEGGDHLDARMILRATLPQPDLSPVLDAGGKGGLRLTLARDVDGKPVDVLDIGGHLETRRARLIEDLLWSLLPETRLSETRSGDAVLGQYTDGHNRTRQSHSLALTQLLITHHLVKAASGPHGR